MQTGRSLGGLPREVSGFAWKAASCGTVCGKESGWHRQQVGRNQKTAEEKVPAQQIPQFWNAIPANHCAKLRRDSTYFLRLSLPFGFSTGQLQLEGLCSCVQGSTLLCTAPVLPRLSRQIELNAASHQAHGQCISGIHQSTTALASSLCAQPDNLQQCAMHREAM
jgi:hypothetical protein